MAFHSNFLSGMHGFRDNEVLLQAGYDARGRFTPRHITDSERATMIS